MPNPLRDSTGWSKAVAVSGMVLLVSLGLCGINYVAVLALSSRAADGATAALIVTAYLELAGMILGAIALVVSLIGLAMHSSRSRRREE